MLLQADIKPKVDGCNGLRYDLTVDVIDSIFRTYPAGIINTLAAGHIFIAAPAQPQRESCRPTKG